MTAIQLDTLDDLTDAQRGVIDRVLAEESAKRNHLVVYLSGSHAYGFPSKDSDFDIKAAHVAETSELLGRKTRDDFELSMVIDPERRSGAVVFVDPDDPLAALHAVGHEIGGRVGPRLDGDL